MGSKFEDLKNYIADMESVIVAFSGGVDSTVLTHITKQALDESCLAVTGISESLSRNEVPLIEKLIEQIGIKHLKIDTKEIFKKEFKENTPLRCYHCKKELFGKLKNMAAEKGYNYVLEGSNYDDVTDYRPGMKAGEELEIEKPFVKFKITKNEIREYARTVGLPNWNKPATPCLSSRFPYGEHITKNKLDIIDEAELFIRNLGFNIVRVRHHNDIARIEIERTQFNKFLNSSNEINDKLKSLGYKYVTLDIQGFRSGSLNEAL